MTRSDKTFLIWALFAAPFFVACAPWKVSRHNLAITIHQVENLAAVCGPGVLACAAGTKYIVLPAWKEPRVSHHALTVETGPPKPGCNVACGKDGHVYTSTLDWCGSLAHFAGEAIVDATGAPVPRHQWWLLAHEVWHLIGERHGKDYKCKMPA